MAFTADASNLVPDDTNNRKLKLDGLAKVKKACHFERQREIFLLNHWVLLRFLQMVEMTL